MAVCLRCNSATTAQLLVHPVWLAHEWQLVEAVVEANPSIFLTTLIVLVLYAHFAESRLVSISSSPKNDQ